MNEDLQAFINDVKALADGLALNQSEVLGAYGLYLNEQHNNFHRREEAERNRLYADSARSQIELQTLAKDYHAAAEAHEKK